ncbi:piggyBac transposable element-derived protein 4-like [Bufo gargarizans]|uniref:piggyBac transposable element-derived protein 4-like n=1 Tax=Bufo gargarizans TaxID=30331 RepID=UPI001CF49198|nr:piggyBac transposable element-derived protein 4-like [Bufo gargarizans]
MAHGRRFTAEQVYAMICSDTESASEGDMNFIASSSSNESDEPPRRRQRVDDQSNAPIWAPPDNYVAQVPNFTADAGTHVNTTGFREIDFFKLFFTDNLISLMVVQTNLYANQFIAMNPTTFHAPKWTPTDAGEMRTFWGIVLSMGLVKKPSIRAYWSTDILYHNPMYRAAMSRMRFEAIMKFIHYNDNTRCPPQDDPNFDRLYKLRPIISHFNSRFAELYTPDKHIVVDESLVNFKGRLHFRQYLPNKRARYGIKLYKLCESETGYTHRFKIYEGKDSKIEPPECPPTLGISGKIVWDLVHPLLDQGYHLYLDNFYSNISLFKCLANRSTVACGTIRKNQKGLPKTLLGQMLRVGESRALCNENILCVKYKDKRDVLMLTTIHCDISTLVPVRGTGTETPKPVCIQEYNKFMGGVDLSDQVLKPYSAMRKSRIWYKKLVVHLTQVALYNAFVLYRNAGQEGTFLEFQENVIKALIYWDREEAGPSTTSTCAETRIVPGQHFPSEISPTAKKSKPLKRCRVCYKNGIRKETSYQCETCPSKPGLCMKRCFKIYHTTFDV